MIRHLRDIVKFRGDKLFHGAVNIGWFGTDESRTKAAARAFVFHGPTYHGVSQTDVGTAHGHHLQDTASFTRSLVRRCYGIEDQPFTLAIAGYGTGKSHMALTLSALLSCPTGDTAKAILAGIEAADHTIGSEIRTVLREARQPCLVVALNGMQSFDLTTEVTQQIMRQVKAAGLEIKPLDELRPRFSQAASLIRMARTNRDLVKEIVTACDVEKIDAVLARLEQQDELAYSKVHTVFLARGMPITALGGESVRDVIDVAVREYCGDGKLYRSLLILFDEFGRYTEFATVRSQIAGSGALQDLFEGIQANTNAVCFAGFIQFELNTYVQRVAPEHRNEILRYVTRYQAANRVYLSINLETLIANLLEKKSPRDLDRWFDDSRARQDSIAINKKIARWYPQSRNHRLWCDQDQFHSVIRKGCWPLSAYSTWFLFHLAAAGKHLQERSAIALLGDTFDRFKDAAVEDGGTWCLAPVDFWSDALQQELITSEEGGQQGSITHVYASVDARHGAQLADNLKRLLRAVVLASKMGLKVSDKDEAIEALSELGGLDPSIAKKGVSLLHKEYNVLEWDDVFKEFDILSDAVPRTQFLSFVSQRVASTYDEPGKAALFASKASRWCDLLGDLECDFAEENEITTREWRYQGVTSSLEVLPMQVKLAYDRWACAIGVDDPRGTIIYCYVEPSRELEAVVADTGKLLRSAAIEAGTAALPILVVLLSDEEGILGQALAELAVLDESMSEEDRVRFGNLTAAHKEKMLQVVRSQVESMIKKRFYITGFKEKIEAHRLSHAGTDLFARIYKNPVTFPFDGFSTARGNAADSCQELTAELLLGRLDYDAVMGKPVRIKNRAITVLKDAWGIFAQNGNVRSRPSQPIIRSLTEKWDDLLVSGDRRLPLGTVLRQLCAPPYGANAASAGLFLGVFVAPRQEKMNVVRSGQAYAVSQWVQDGIFRGKFIDIQGMHDVDLVLLGEGSSEWDVLLDEWEQAENYSAKCACLKRADELKARVPVPPTLRYREIHLEELSRVALKAIVDFENQQKDAVGKIESGIERNDVGSIAWGGGALTDLITRIESEKPLWTEHQIKELRPDCERARQGIVQCFSEWLARQAPRDGTPDATGDFKHKMLRLIGPNLKKLGFDELCQELEARTFQIIKNVEMAADARQLIRDVRSWITAHGDAARIGRVAEIRALQGVGKEYTSKMKAISEQVRMPDVAEVRSQLSDTMAKMQDAEAAIVKRASKLWQTKLQSEDDLANLPAEVESLTTSFENCDADLQDLSLMRHALRMYQNSYHQLENERLTWREFEILAGKCQSALQEALGDKELPWPPAETINGLVAAITKRRYDASKAWIDALEAESAKVAGMSASDANHLHLRATNAPAVITEVHAKRLKKVVKDIESRLDNLKIEWLVEKYKELPVQLRKKFLQIIRGVDD